MIYITINSKGGVGKSTFANQILPAYLYQKNNKATKLIEIDDENEDSKILTKSEILNAERIHTSEIKKIDEIFIDSKDIILDIGGNKTATIFLSEMKMIGETENITWFIPTGSGVQDAANALDTYLNIKKLNDNASIIFVLSNVRSDDLEWEFIHFFGSEFLNTPFSISKHIDNYHYISIKNGNIVNHAKTFNKTVYDIAQNPIDFRSEAKKAKANGGETLMRKHLFLNRVKNEAIEYIDELQNSTFKDLNKLL